jgi:anti-sigma-K factor RskA
VKHERTTDEISERAALYALGALSQHEARAFESHLRDGCAVCETELRQHERVAEMLGLAAHPAPPPSYLRDLLAARIEREPREGISPAATAAPSAPPAEDSSGRAYPDLYETLHPTPPARPRSRAPWAAAAAILVAAAAGLIVMRRQFGETLRVEQQDARAARLESVRLRGELETARRRAEELDAVRTALASPGVRVVELAGQKEAPSSSGRIYWDTGKGRWLVAASLPPAPTGKVYQLWFVTAQAKVPAGLIPTDTAGHGFAIVDVPPTVGKVAFAAITLEPEGGSAQPTLPIYVIGKVS